MGSLTQLILVSRLNQAWGVPDFVFAVGDEFIIDITNALLQMPILILLATICPKGLEGSIYALVTSAQKAGGTVGETLSGSLIRHFAITLTDFANFEKLIILCAGLRLLTLPLLKILPTRPKENDDNEAFDFVKEPESKCGAAVVIIMIVCGLFGAVGA